MIWPAIALIAAIVVAVVVGAVLLHKALTDSRADADKNFGTNPVGCPTQGCPLVKWVWDDPHTKDRRQYVNLPADWDPAKNGTAHCPDVASIRLCSQVARSKFIF